MSGDPSVMAPPDVEQAEAEPVPPSRTLLREYAETVIIAVIFVLFIKTFAFQQFKIPTGSMEDTLLIGDYLMVNKFIYGVPTGTVLDRALPMRDIRRKDVVVFRYPDEPEVDFIKRVAGAPGDRVSIKAKVLTVNGETIEEPYRKLNSRSLMKPPDSYREQRIPEASYFMLGDNRDNSNDSRVWGTVPRAMVRGRAFVIWWSFVEAPDAWEKRDARSRAAQLLEKLRHFLSKTRWRRILTVVR